MRACVCVWCVETFSESARSEKHFKQLLSNLKKSRGMLQQKGKGCILLLTLTIQFFLLGV